MKEPGPCEPIGLLEMHVPLRHELARLQPGRSPLVLFGLCLVASPMRRSMAIALLEGSVLTSSTAINCSLARKQAGERERGSTVPVHSRFAAGLVQRAARDHGSLVKRARSPLSRPCANRLETGLHALRSEAGTLRATRGHQPGITGRPRAPDTDSGTGGGGADGNRLRSEWRAWTARVRPAPAPAPTSRCSCWRSSCWPPCWEWST